MGALSNTVDRIRESDRSYISLTPCLRLVTVRPRRPRGIGLAGEIRRDCGSLLRAHGWKGIRGERIRAA